MVPFLCSKVLIFYNQHAISTYYFKVVKSSQVVATGISRFGKTLFICSFQTVDDI